MLTELQNLLEAFQRQCDPGDSGYSWCHQHEGGEHTFHVVFGVMVHGNEVGALPSALRLLAALRAGSVRFGGRVSIFLGNPEAALQQRRCLDSDLNRVFVLNDVDDHEHRRARELMPLLGSADLFIDFHQTILDSAHPFYIYNWSHEGDDWCRALGGSRHWVTRAPGLSFSSGTCCADEFVRNQGRHALTLELGRMGFLPEAASVSWRTMIRALSLVDAIASGQTSLPEQAKDSPTLFYHHTIHREPFSSPELALRPGLFNFQSVRAGEVLSAPSSTLIQAACDGALLFPKYPLREAGRAVSPIPNEIFRIVTPLPDSPHQMWGNAQSGSQVPSQG